VTKTERPLPTTALEPRRTRTEPPKEIHVADFKDRRTQVRAFHLAHDPSRLQLVLESEGTYVHLSFECLVATEVSSQLSELLPSFRDLRTGRST